MRQGDQEFLVTLSLALVQENNHFSVNQQRSVYLVEVDQWVAQKSLETAKRVRKTMAFTLASPGYELHQGSGTSQVA